MLSFGLLMPLRKYRLPMQKPEMLMLELRPNCEHCNKDLAPHASDAMICSFECTFCRDCVTTVLQEVCPNCGGNFSVRPQRPLEDWNNQNNLSHYPASQHRKYRPVDLTAHAALLARQAAHALTKKT